MKAQHLELTYSQYGLLYEVFPYALWSILDKTRQRSRPQADRIVGSVKTKPTDQLSNQLQQFSLQQKTSSQTIGSAYFPYSNFGCTQCTIKKPKGHSVA
jgi:hypothetical protein